jgi:stage V sporulation protein G
MDITEVRVKLEEGDSRLKAFACVTLDHVFVVRDFRVIDGGGPSGLFVSCPSRKLLLNCPQCRSKNHCLAFYCNDCGAQLPRDTVPKEICRTCGGHGCRGCNGTGERTKLFADVAHPVTRDFRLELEDAVVAAYKAELSLAKQSGYRSVYADPDASLRFTCASGAVRGA